MLQAMRLESMVKDRVFGGLGKFTNSTGNRHSQIGDDVPFYVSALVLRHYRCASKLMSGRGR